MSLHSKRLSFEADNASTKSFAEQMDAVDPLFHFRSEYCIPSKSDLKDPHPEAKIPEEQNG
jgi:kynureninase